MSKPYERWKQHPHMKSSLLSEDGAVQVDFRVSPWHMKGGDAEAAERSQRAVAFFLASEDMARALEPLARFVEKFDQMPMRGISDTLYGIHCGTPYEADINLSDLRKAVAALEKAGVL